MAKKLKPKNKSKQRQLTIIFVAILSVIGARLVFQSFAATGPGQETSRLCPTAVYKTCKAIGSGGGLTYWQDGTIPNKKVHVVRLDLTSNRYAIRASTPAEKAKTPSAFAKLTKSAVAINGGFFNTSNFQPTGLAVGNGIQWPQTKDLSGGTTYLACKNKNSCIIDDNYGAASSINPSVYTQVVGGSGILISQTNSYRWTTKPGDPGCSTVTGNLTCGAAYPRTAVGLNAAKTVMFWVMVEGGQPNLTGVSMYDLTTIMEKMGAKIAINLDGGGSSGMVINGSLVNKRQTNELKERVVANSIGIVELPAN